MNQSTRARNVLITLMVSLVGGAGLALALTSVTIPRSDMYVEGEIRFKDGSVAQFEGREGALVTVKHDPAASTATGLVFLLTEDPTKAKVLILKIETKGEEKISGNSPPKEVKFGLEFEIKQSEPVVLILKKTGSRRFKNPPGNVQNQAAYLDERCCVKFGDKEICSNAVKTKAMGACSK